MRNSFFYWAARLAIPAAFGLTAMATPGCSAASEEEAASSDTNELTNPAGLAPSDAKATAATKAVFANLASYGADGARKKILFGQQEADVANTSQNGLTPIKSDVERVTGKKPALISYELSAVYPGSKTMFDPEGFRAGAPALRDLIKANHKKGILVSLVWHPRCPKAASSDPDKYKVAECPADYNLEELLAEPKEGVKGKHFEEWRKMLDELADLLTSVKDADGNAIPVQLRPFHEFTGDWFWWGRQNSPSTYQRAWKEMVSYLRDKRGVHNVLWVFCPDKPTDDWQIKDGGDFEKFYPGDGFVDVIGFDRYDFDDGKFLSGYEADIAKVGAFARAHKKVAAVTEVGRNMKDLGMKKGSNWFTQSMLAPLQKGEGRYFSYVALWRNAPWEKYMAEPGDDIATDFKAMTGVVLAGDDGNPYSSEAPSSS